MMQGFVNQSCEAIIRIAGGHANLPKQMVEELIDTGFTGFLSLPPSTIIALSERESHHSSESKGSFRYNP